MYNNTMNVVLTMIETSERILLSDLRNELSMYSKKWCQDNSKRGSTHLKIISDDHYSIYKDIFIVIIIKQLNEWGEKIEFFTLDPPQLSAPSSRLSALNSRLSFSFFFVASIQLNSLHATQYIRSNTVYNFSLSLN